MPTLIKGHPDTMVLRAVGCICVVWSRGYTTRCRSTRVYIERERLIISDARMARRVRAGGSVVAVAGLHTSLPLRRGAVRDKLRQRSAKPAFVQASSHPRCHVTCCLVAQRSLRGRDEVIGLGQTQFSTQTSKFSCTTMVLILKSKMMNGYYHAREIPGQLPDTRLEGGDIKPARATGNSKCRCTPTSRSSAARLPCLLLLRKGGQIVYSSVRAANRHRPSTPNDGRREQTSTPMAALSPA